MNAREEIAKAVAVKLSPAMGLAAHAGADAVLRSHGIDPDAALAEAREAPRSSGLAGALRKDAASAGAAGARRIVLTGPCDDGGKVRMEMDAAEGVSLLHAVRKALREAGVYE